MHKSLTLSVLVVVGEVPNKGIEGFLHCDGLNEVMEGVLDFV